MANFKKAIAVVLGVLVAGSFAACASNKTSSDASSAQTSSSESKAESSAEKKSDGPVTIKISWWGGDSRHKATQDAIKKFMEKKSEYYG
jgi:oligogalacturonide transport system substrate-binding protein